MPIPIAVNLDDFAAISETLGLDQGAANLLLEVVGGIAREISEHRTTIEGMAAGRSRTARIAHFRRLSSLLTKLERTLADRDPNTDRLLRNALGDVLGNLLSDTGFEELLGQKIGGASDRNQRMPQSRIRSEEGYKDLERAMLARSRNVASHEAPKLLLRLIQELNMPLLRFLEIERHSKGGAPGNIYRNYAVRRLIPVYQQIWGADPATTPEGKFVMLCELVLQLLGIGTEGVEGAVERILRQARRV